jgi:hypothetical protein
MVRLRTLLPPLGTLTQDADIPDWWVSQPVAVPFLSGRRVPFTVTLRAAGDGYPPDATEAIEQFLALGPADREAAAGRVFQNYRDFADAVSEVDVEITGPARVWDHVRVTGVYVDRRHRWDGDVYVKVACDCDWEVEHGLQMVFRRGARLVRVSAQDGHLTHADAYDLPADQDE